MSSYACRRLASKILRLALLMLVVIAPQLPALLPTPAVAVAPPSEDATPERLQPATRTAADQAAPIQATAVEPAPGAAEAAASATAAASPIAADLLPAYMQTIDLGDGDHVALLAADPLNYLAPDGQWQPIDPRFTAELDGFANLSNLLQVRTPARQAILHVAHGDLEARWTPQSLLLAADGRETVLAKPRPAADGAGATLGDDGRTLTYPDSWTLPGLADEIIAGPGEAEHNVIFAGPPELGARTPGDGAQLVLAATLELPPGVQLYANGALQTAAFTTTATVELREAGTARRLQMPPAVVYERDRPDQQIVATYAFESSDARGWRVRMTTPWSWWADPARQYPVVWDPLMQVLRALSVAQIYDNAVCAPYLNARPDFSGVGRAPCYAPFGFIKLGESRVRTLLRFDQVTQLNLPPGAQIQGAVLLVSPTDAYHKVASDGEFNTDVNTQLHRVTQAWDPNTVTWGSQPGVDPNPYRSSSASYAGRTDPPLSVKVPRYRTRYTGTKWLIQEGPTGVVSDWLSGGPNYGLELRAVPADENSCGPRGLCEFVRIPKRGIWTDVDRDLLFDNDFEATQSGGFMLIVRYKGPTLPNNTPYTYANPAPKPPKFADEDFHRTRHVYSLPAPTGSPWLAVGVKGFRKSVVFDNVAKVGLFSYAFWSQTEAAAAGEVAAAAPNPNAFAFPLAIAPEGCTKANCETRSEGGGSTDGSNFVLLSQNSVAGREVRIDPLAPDPKLEQYAAEASWSTPLPLAINPAQLAETGVRQVFTETIGSEHILRAYHLNLPDSVRVRIRLQNTVDGIYTYSAYAKAHLFPPGSGIYGKSLRHEIADEATEIRTVVQPGKGGNFGLVLELPGDRTAFDICTYDKENCEGDGNEDRDPKDRTVQVVLTVQVCPLNAIPSDTGCAFVVKPDWTDPNLWREVPPYRIFSPAGFGACGPSTCAKRYVGSKEYAAIVTWGAEVERMVILTGWRDDPNTVYYTQAAAPGDRVLFSSGVVALGKCAPNNQIDPIFEIADGGVFAGFTGANEGYLYRLYACEKGGCRGLALSQYDLASLYERTSAVSDTAPTLRIRMPQTADDSTAQYAEFTARVVRTLQTDVGPRDQLLELKWQVRAEGYAGWPESAAGTGPLNATATPLNNLVDPAPLAGLSYYFTPSWETYYDPASGYFTEMRNNDGRIVHKVTLGGAWERVDYVVLDFGKAPGGGSGLAICPAFCGDVRAPNDTWAAPNRQWRMPDVLVNQLPNTVLVSSAGGLSVYSTDHPTSLDQTNDTVGFSFKTFNAKVETVNDVCPGSGSNQPVPLIRGAASLSLPGIDPKADPSAAASAIPSIEARFVLCEDSLRQVSLTFKYPPGIPIAAPPVMFIDLIGGTVTIGPANVIIEIEVGFFIGAAVPKIFKGTAKLTLDTRGLFDMQATGRIMGTMDGEGHLWVAWNPLDTGLGSQGWLPNKNDWVLRGFMYAHVWRGSGWQNRYPWLAGNDDFHLTASYQAEFRIKEGAVIDEWPIVVPPGDISIGVELSFGQFCANDNCSDYQWGIKGVVKIAGFRVGAYVNLECDAILAAVVLPPAVLLCTSFILGSDGHILIDQYGGNGPPFPLQAAGEAMDQAQAADLDASLAQLNRQTVANPSAAEVDQPITVKASTASLMVAFGWVRGAPSFALVRPDGQSITAANAASFGVTVAVTPNSLIFGLDNPAPGGWIARVTNATPQDDYRIMVFANKATPGVTFTAPSGTVSVDATGDSTAAQLYTIRWNPPPNAADLRMTLLYSATVPNATSPTYLYGGTIIENIDPATGAFDWDLSHLSSGDYRIYATLQDKQGARVTRLGENQYVGVTTSIAPGILRYKDQKAPPPLDPGKVTFSRAEDGVTMCWDVSPAHDLSEYRIVYRVRDSFWLIGRTMTERVIATVPFAPDARQCMRIGGLVEGDAVVEFGSAQGIAVGDASGNYSSVAQPGNTTVPGGGAHAGPLAPVLSGVASNGNVTLSWPTPARRWDLYYARETFAGPHIQGTGAAQGNTPIQLDDLMFTGSYALTGLTKGYWYAFAVRAYGYVPFAPPSALSNQVWLLVSSGVDSDGDGCPDDWQNAHPPYSPNGNPDQDGLTGKQECQIGTNPHAPDTDGDNVVDGEEVAAGTDPRDPLSYPDPSPAASEAGSLAPRMGLSARQLRFYGFTQGGNPVAQIVAVSNLGNGAFTPAVSANQPWLKPTVVGGNVQVAVEIGSLKLGRYSGVVTVSANPAATLGAPQTISVVLDVLAGNPVNIGPTTPLLLPLIGADFRPAGGAALTVYGDSLAAGWANWSWDTTVDFASTARVHGGSKAIAITHKGPNTGFSVRSPAAINTAGYSAITFWIYGNGKRLALYTEGTDDGPLSKLYTFTAPANQWTQVTVPLSSLGAPAVIKRINLQDDTGAAQPVYYLDDLALKGGAVAAETSQLLTEPGTAADLRIWLPALHQ